MNLNEPQYDLNMLFNPKSVAIVGISPNNNRSTLAYNNLMELGYQGDVYFINGKYTEVHGQKCYSSILEIPDQIDAVFISIPGDYVLPTLEDAVKKGAKGAVVISSGFGEGEGTGVEKSTQLLKLANENNLAICGPNCLGLVSPANDFSSYGFFFPEGMKKGKVGGVFQSGGLMHAIAGELGLRGVGLSKIVSSGNETIINSSHYIEYLANDPDTDIIMAFIEGIKDPARFVRAAEIAYHNKKPIVLVKVGKSEKAAQAAVAHTGSMTGSDSIIDTLFRQKGIIRVNDVDELIETVVLLNNSENPTGNGVAMTTTSGGEAGMYADLGEELGIDFTEFGEQTKEKIKSILPEFGSLGNPLDTTGNAALDKSLYSACLNAIAEDENVNVIAVSQMEITESALKNNKTTQVIVESIQECKEKYNKPIILFTPNAGGADKIVGAMLAEKGIPLLIGAHATMKAVRNLIDYAKFLKTQDDYNVVTNVPYAKGVLKDKSGVLTERESQMVLKEYGIDVPEKTLVHSSDQAIEVAEVIGYPVVMKIESADIPHKSDAGGVKLNLKSLSEVERAYNDIMTSVTLQHPDANINGIVVEEMVTDGVEVIVGAKVDPMFGPVIMVGSGGVLVELLQDVSLRMAPINEREAEDMIRETKLMKLLAGYRGKPEADLEALKDTLVKLSHFAAAHKETLHEIEINPLLVLPKGKGCRAVDGLIVLKANEVENITVG
ncbi:acetate--CoA ligase family protein [bacterium LRH843]|nr:acetate--CoA ligase family protein [bacterium LRH843]